MIKNKKLFSIALGMLACTTASANIQEVMNQPDSVYLFSYATSHDAGRSGLKFAWSADGELWQSVGNGFGYVKCDFGRWGTEKRMIYPRLIKEKDGWTCIWQINPTGKELAKTTSLNLTDWKPQSYYESADNQTLYKRYTSSSATEEAQTITLGKEQLKGFTQKVPYNDVLELNRYANAKQYENELNNERMAQDGSRFAQLKSVTATIKVNPEKKKAISDHLIGIFFEDISAAADGGLYAELVQNRDFEYNSKDRKEWNSNTAWKFVGQNGKQSIATDQPINANNPHYAVLDIEVPGASFINEGFDGIALKKGEKYDFSIFAKKLSGKCGIVTVRLQNNDGEKIAEARINVTSTIWKKLTATLTATTDVKDASLSLHPEAEGKYGFDMVSLFPRKTFKGRKNGLRADLAQTLADLHPRFVRFPGGCVAHGNGVDNIYDWKGSIGPLEARKPLSNLWGYHQTRGLGYHEYFQFCEDIGASPLPVLAAGVSCQNSSSPSHFSTNVVTTCGQQGGIPMNEMPQYVQDVLDLIEYANGDAKKTVWGKKRAEAGHPKPFNLKFVGIGNEDLISDVFKERFEMIFKAVKEKYPNITVIGTVGPFYEGSDYNEGWRFATELGVPIVDEHYYCKPGWFINNQHYYDGYDRKKSKVYLGEYSAQFSGAPNVESALAEALYLTNVERNADVVSMTSYAPLMAKEKRINWNPDLIYFNNTEIKPSTGYYVQQLFGQNSGDEYITSDITLDNKDEKVRKRLNVSVVTDSKTGDIIIKMANLLPVSAKTSIELPQLNKSMTAKKTVLCGKPSDKKMLPIKSTSQVSSHFTEELPAYSFTVLRILGNRK